MVRKCILPALLILSLTLVACGQATTTPSPTPSPTATATLNPSPTPTPTAEHAQTPLATPTPMDDLCPDYNPLGYADWSSEVTFEDFKDSDLVVKVKVTGHRLVSGAWPEKTLMNDAEVLEVFKGELPGKEIAAASGGRICLVRDGLYYLFLREPVQEPVYTGGGPPVYYIRHPFAQFPVSDGRIEVFEPFVRDGFLPAVFNGLSEAAFVKELQRLLE